MGKKRAKNDRFFAIFDFWLFFTIKYQTNLARLKFQIWYVNVW